VITMDIPAREPFLSELSELIARGEGHMQREIKVLQDKVVNKMRRLQHPDITYQTDRQISGSPPVIKNSKRGQGSFIYGFVWPTHRNERFKGQTAVGDTAGRRGARAQHIEDPYKRQRAKRFFGNYSEENRRRTKISLGSRERPGDAYWRFVVLEFVLGHQLGVRNEFFYWMSVGFTEEVRRVATKAWNKAVREQARALAERA